MRRLLAVLVVCTACMQSRSFIVPDFVLTSQRMLPSAASAAREAAKDTGPKLTLAQAYQLALTRSEQVALAASAVEDADIAWNEKWTEIGPNLTATGSIIEQRERVVGMTVFAPGQQLVGNLTFAQPVFRRGFFDSRAAGKYGHASAAALLHRERELLARDVAAVFIDVLKFRQLLELAQTSVTRTKSQYTFAVARVKAGQALKNAELLAEIDVKRAELQEVNARRDAASAEVAFTRLVGKPPPPQLEFPAMPTIPNDKRARDLAARRADLQALVMKVQWSRAEEEAAAGRRLWPRLDVTANLQYVDPEVFGNHVDWQVAGVLTIPLLQGGREYTELSRRENATHAASLELERSRKLVVEELDVAAAQIAAATRAAELAKEQLDAAKEHYALVDKQVRLGAITFLEVANAQAVLVEAENTQEVATMDKLRATYDYLYAIGEIDLSK
jgi:outer membrane protein